MKTGSRKSKESFSQQIDEIVQFELPTFNNRISRKAIFLIAGSSSDSTNRLTATSEPVSRSRHLYTTP